MVVMAIVDDDMREDLAYSSLLESLNSDLSEDALSLENVSWVDSCLNKDADPSNADWSSVKDALLEILSSQQPTDDEILHYRSLEFGKGSGVDEDVIYDDVVEVESIELSEDDEDIILVNKHGRVKGKNRFVNVFRPHYREDNVTAEALDSGLDSGLTTYEESLSEDIFKVWDLGISDELDDITRQLAIAEIPPQIRSAGDDDDDDSTSWKDCLNVSVDDLIDRVGGLSLAQNTE